MLTRVSHCPDRLQYRNLGQACSLCEADSTHTTPPHTHTRYTDDESSPLVCDPYNEEEYTYSILSKHLVKKPAKPAAVAAKPVVRDECKGDSAQNVHAILEDGGRVTALHTSKTGLTGQSSTETSQPSSTQIPAQN